ncbi:asparagine synthase C-terminal domain-containing protein [Thiobacillus sp. 65-1402]|uniref:asparagine synthetase B family protein n=1 Tax=Thiobacillus sp. 65-1402 TaxID=1895861 RepID=UPI0009612FB8|nr:asparagine synthase C-terminal domain-containing protein [Thiobacillus sp. 65-1402]OJW93051.1 MAG: asparagine synthase [Thiobacillus sp. 65-1402]
MDGIFGWLGDHGAHQDLIRHMGRAACLSPEGLLQQHSSQVLGVAACSRFGKADIHVENGLAAALHGRPRFLDDELAQIARDQNPAMAVAYGWLRFGEKLPTLMHGNFAFAVIEPLKKKACLALDRVGAERLCYAQRGGHLVFGSSVQNVAAHPAVGRSIDPQAIYDYLYFHTLPAPRSLYQGVRKLLPGQIVTLKNGTLSSGFYWQADYAAVDADFDSHRRDFRAILDQAVRDADAPVTAAFLSGGTDSSTVVGALTAARQAPVDTFSIGFDAAGFDEMEYARCAAERYDSRRHEYYLKPADIVTAIPVIAREYDEPFGNASAVPTYFCAQAAREAGFERMLAGDGGDEIFGGNVRYAKQRLFETYARLPALLRHGMIEPLTLLPGLSSRFPLAKLKSYVDQAKVGLPLRLESYNFLHRTPLEQIFATDFIDAVDPSAPGAALSEAYERTASDHYINRMMHLDLKFTLADNDLRKVGTMTEAAGIEVRYPLLDDRLVAFANHLPVDYKVRGQKLRWFFKEALRDLLPEQIINKTKHGFGLPFGVWSTQYAPLGELVGDSLADFKQRGWIRPAYLDHMLAMQRGPHASYYGVMIWLTMMLEQWLQANEH